MAIHTIVEVCLLVVIVEDVGMMRVVGVPIVFPVTHVKIV